MSFGWLTILLAILTAQSQPTFRSQVELLRLDVSVVDNAGEPVRDLHAEDFFVKVDGKPRGVSFARFYGPDAGATTAPGDAPSFATNTGSIQGRVVVIVVDLESMKAGYEKLVLDTAGALVDRLGPADSVGLILIPGKGIDLTRDHRRVREALEHARGFATDSDRDHAMTVREAEAFALNDRRVTAEVIERECRRDERMCPADLEREARQLLIDADRQIRDLLNTLSDLNGKLSGIEAPRTVVVLSAGLPYRQDSDSYFRELRRRSAESGTTTYVVRLEQPETDAASRGKPGTGSLLSGDLEQGLSNVAGVTGGSMYAGIGRATGVFDRIRSEIIHSYQLGIESVPADANGKSHKIEVQVRRPDAVVRARREFIIPTEPRPARTAVEVIGLPPGLAEVPLAMAAYNTRGEEPNTLKLVVLLESGAVDLPSPPAYAFTITSAGDKPAFQTAGRLTAGRVTVGAQIAPGRYSLRGAIVDAQGRAGSVELPIVVGVRQAGELQLSDVIVGTSTSAFAPSTRITPPQVTAILELYTTDPSRFEGISVELELSSEGKVLATGPATVARTALDRRQVAEGRINVPELAPGIYTVSAIVRRAGQPVARVSRELVR